MIDGTTKTTGREEDYRDYEDRDVNEGWPYADGTPGSETKVANGSYGQSSENFDEAGNPGFERSSDTAIESANGPDLFGDDTEADVEDDALEDLISNALEDSEIETSGVDLKARRGAVLLSGTVDTAQERRQIESLIYGIPGVTKIRNALRTSGVDEGIPKDWDE
ncbi:BON domain-containing protein [Pararhizobium sp. O133]|uniref:BON domain-containing protein n=1 Tax=Pararhizobium sp. O133 TaxID=3449278 RepID=UPI003F688DF8